MTLLKDVFQDYFNNLVGPNDKAEITINGYKLQRQIRKMEKYNEDVTVKRIEELKLNDLDKTIKKPDVVKIKATLNLGFLLEGQLKECIATTYTPAISVKTLTYR